VIVFAAIAPHGELDEVPELRAAMEELGRRFDAAAPETTVAVTPHGVHVEGHLAVVTAGRVGETATDRDLARAILRSLREERIPALGVSYGGNDPAEAVMPIDWGTEIPLAFTAAERIVVVSPARDVRLEDHVRAGAALARAIGSTRVALVASADHAHTHAADGPYGFDPSAEVYDVLLQEILASGRLDFAPLGLVVDAAKADSLWQLLVLQGAVGDGATVDVLAYAVPTYFGMLCAEVRPKRS